MNVYNPNSNPLFTAAPMHLSMSAQICTTPIHAHQPTRCSIQGLHTLLHDIQTTLPLPLHTQLVVCVYFNEYPKEELGASDKHGGGHHYLEN